MPITNYCPLGFTEEENVMLLDAEQAIEKACMWEWMKEEPGEWGYFMSTAPQMMEIRKYMKYVHIGKTFGTTMKEMQMLAILGEDGYRVAHTQFVPQPVKKVQLVRSAEMDAKVLEEYHNRPAFARAPKWSFEYTKAFPDVLRSLNNAPAVGYHATVRK